MDALKDFNIPYVGLKNGEHLFEYQIGKRFFDSFESTAIHDGDIKVKLVFDKKLKPMIGHTFKLNQAVDIIDQFEKGKIKTKGKIVFSI